MEAHLHMHHPHLDINPDRHAVHVAGGGGLQGVDVGVCVHPEHHGARVVLEGAGHGAQPHAVVTTQGNRHLITTRRTSISPTWPLARISLTLVATSLEKSSTSCWPPLLPTRSPWSVTVLPSPRSLSTSPAARSSPGASPVPSWGWPPSKQAPHSPTPPSTSLLRVLWYLAVE